MPDIKINDYDADSKYMKLALREAERAAAEGEIPVGCVITRGGEVIACGRNTRERGHNALGHAEISAINAACAALDGWRLSGCTLYVTLEPCVMCAGAIVNARVERVVYGAADAKAGAFGSVLNLNSYPLNHKPVITQGVLAGECGALLSAFFAAKRKAL